MDHKPQQDINNNKDHYLKQLNKLSYRISKSDSNNSSSGSNNATRSINGIQSEIKKPSFDQTVNQQPNQHQPPVYNINKNDFRVVVQKLTGSPAHERISNPSPPPIQTPKPPSSRLHRIRPPPLAHVSNRPPPMLNSAVASQQILNPMPVVAPTSGFPHRPTAPLSPLPPLPAVHAAAESPISVYMRYLQNSISAVDSNKQFSGFEPLVSPRWSNQHQQFSLPPPPPQPQQSAAVTSPTQIPFPFPSSPLPFGCLNSPLSQHPLLSPSSFPLSPTVPVPSPTGRGH